MTDRAIALEVGEGQRSTERLRGVGRGFCAFAVRDPFALICAFILLIIVLAAVFAPEVAPADPYKTSMLHRLRPPGSPGALLGTDELGRDMLSRLIFGGRISLFMGFTPVLLATLVGGAFGLIAGYAGGWLNAAVMRTMDVFYAFPSVLLAVGVSGVLGGGVFNGLLSLTIVFIPPIVRVSESVTVQVRSQDYVEAARATGASGRQILTGHVLGNVVGPIFAYGSGLIGVSIVIAAGLSFLGLGVAPPAAEWGLMLSALRDSIYIAPSAAIAPGVMILVTSLCFNVISDRIRDAMEIRR